MGDLILKGQRHGDMGNIPCPTVLEDEEGEFPWQCF
jgi:hypothetical protein